MRATLAAVSTSHPLPPPDPDDVLELRWRRAHLVTGRLLAWPWPLIEGATYELHHAPDGGLRIEGDHLAEGGRRLAGAAETLPLHPDPAGIPSEVTARDGRRHLAGRSALSLDVEVTDDRLGGQLAVTVTGPRGGGGGGPSGGGGDGDGGGGGLLAATGVQHALALDERFATEAPLGVTWHDGRPSCALWAPTARRVRLHREPAGAAAVGGTGDGAAVGAADGAVEVHDLTRGDDGVWRIDGEPSWDRCAYRYEVEVYDADEDRVVRDLVTDPWSVALTADSERSRMVDLARFDAADLAPPGWASGTPKPAFADQARMVVYELHVRDFSAADASVPEELRGTYRAFTLPTSAGVRHLRRLAEAGVTHLHLLPINDIATIPERWADRVSVGDPAAAGRATTSTTLDPASPEPQERQQSTRERQAFNWGYDPWHWLVPEGSYATPPHDTNRILEVREMVAAINRLGLRVVIDVVFNHHFAAGRAEHSVLDRVVPGYFHRLDDLGRVTTSTCCPNTATEHAMMERLILDAVRTWAVAYRVDGFRFDLLGHHPRAQAVRIRQALDRLTLERDGVDGRAIVLYGEGWEFGEVAGDARFVQATQRGLHGTGIGTFDDRLRDAVRGGNHDGPLREQGVFTGLGLEPNRADGVDGGGGGGSSPAVPAHDRQRAAELADHVRLGVAGSLADLRIPCHDGVLRPGRDLRYGGAPTGYTARPQEQVAYVSAHDNETLFDALAAKLPAGTSGDDRVRMQVLAMAPALFAQGTPSVHAGSELLRSKSLDRDSYRSGDPFNAIDWTGATSLWGVGLPPSEANGDRWPEIAALLRAIPAPSQAQVLACRDRVLELVRIRARSPLFGLPSLAAVRRHLRFHLAGPDAPLGVIAWSLHGEGRADHDLLVALNARPWSLDVEVAPDNPSNADGSSNAAWRLHPVLARSADPVVRGASCGPRGAGGAGGAGGPRGTGGPGGAADATALGLHVPARTVAVFLRPHDHPRRPTAMGNRPSFPPGPAPR